jgi:hypothetical protein
MRDVIFHLADPNMEAGFRAFFARDDWHYVLGCSRFKIDPESEQDIYRLGGETDGGLRKRAHTNLTLFQHLYRHAVIVLDADFKPSPGAEALQKEISANMLAAGWSQDAFCVVVIDKELEAWLWAPNINVAKAFGHEDFEAMRRALADKKLWDAGSPKPNDLKAARDLAARLGGRKTGGPLFRGVFSGMSKRACDLCQESGFVTLRSALQRWFPPDPGAGV